MRKLFFAIMMVTSAAVCAQNLTTRMFVTMKNGEVINVNIDSVESIIFDSTYVAPVVEDSRIVDLGLSVKWASCNVGATEPEELGDLYSWGEVTPKNNYEEESYLYYVNSQYQNIGADICGTEYDVVKAVWGEEWRMPTRRETEELMNKCSWLLATKNDVAGYWVTGPSGKSIFLPLAGYSYGTERQKVGKDGYYWSGTLDTGMPSSAYNLNFKNYDTSWSACRAYGFSVRPVRP